MAQLQQPIQMQAKNDIGESQVRQKNRTGLPDNLKEGIEKLSGLSMDDVTVNYNSKYPIKLGALALTQGTEIHIAAGQEKHLPHEAWHVVQQKQGRVRQEGQENGQGINDSPQLEHEAEVNGIGKASSAV